MRVGGQVGGVGLHQHLVQRHHRERVAQVARVLEGHRAGEAEQVSALHALPGHADVAAEAVHHRLLRCPLLGEDPQHVLVGVPVVDLQRPAQLLGLRDVPAEGLDLHTPPLRRGAEVVEPRLPHHPDALTASQPVDLLQRRLELTRRRQDGHLVRVQGHPAQHLGVPVHDRCSMPRRLEIAPDLHQPVDPHGAGLGDDPVHAVVGPHRHPVALDVDVGVVVHHGHRQRLGRRRALGAARAGVRAHRRLTRRRRW
ncbi:hypothetical protein BJF82_11395 [Kytococcus sp. CUA-901]|nr:hypothetical protein BJF82_11395 [Kytococcus sp. CUA-901]